MIYLLPTLPRSISETPFTFVDVEGDQKENDASTKNKPCKLDDITSLLRGSALFLTFRKQIVAACQQRKRVFCKWWRADAIVSSSTASQCHFIAMHFCSISSKAASLPTIEEASIDGEKFLQSCIIKQYSGSECCHGRVYNLYT